MIFFRGDIQERIYISLEQSSTPSRKKIKNFNRTYVLLVLLPIMFFIKTNVYMTTKNFKRNF